MKQKRLLMVGLLFCFSANAQLMVVNTDGPTVPSAPYLKEIHYPSRGDALKRLQMNKALFNGKRIQIKEVIYPATSDLTPGKIKSHPLGTQNVERPIFVMGDDPFSVTWAKRNRRALKKSGALGIITNVKNQARVKAIENEIGLTLLPAQLSGLSDYVPVKHTPFLWTKRGIEQ